MSPMTHTKSPTIKRNDDADIQHLRFPELPTKETGLPYLHLLIGWVPLTSVALEWVLQDSAEHALQGQEAGQ